MTPPVNTSPNLRNCPEEIRENPLPFDECSEPVEPWLDAHERYRLLSVHLDGQWGHELAPESQFSNFGRMGVGMVFRPFPYTPVGVWGLGFQFDTNFTEEFVALGRLQTSINIQQAGRERITLAFQGGVRHLYGLPIQPEGRSEALPLGGTLGVLGGEISLESRFSQWGVWGITLIPFISVQATLPGELQSESGETFSYPAGVNLLVGGRVAFDFFPIGEPPGF